MRRIVLGCGLLLRGDRLLLVRCRYPDEAEPLWALPGGGHEPGEPLARTVQREFLEETSLTVLVERIAYVSESIDPAGGLHVLNCTFWVRESDAQATPAPADRKVVEARFIPVADAAALLEADVLRIPVAATLGRRRPAGDAEPQYYFFDARELDVPFFGRAARRAQAEEAGRDPHHG